MFVAKIFGGNGNVTCVVGNRTYPFTKSHLNYAKLVEAVQNNDSDAFVKLYDVQQALNTVVVSSNGKVQVIGETVYYNGQPCHNSMTDRMIHLLRDGQDINYLVKFLDNLMENPSRNSVEQAYSFLEHHGIPITEDGCFLAKKAVRSDYYDKYSGTILNKPGLTISVPRNTVDDKEQNHCSYGLHVGGDLYSGKNGWYRSHGDKVLLVKINPKNIVSCPTDHNFTKLRVCEYEVLCECEEVLNKSVYSGSGINDDDYCADEYCDDCDYENEDSEFEIDARMLRVSDMITFDYNKEGIVKTRYVDVTEINTVDEFIIGELLYPEVNAGETRKFLFNKMSRVQLM